MITETEMKRVPEVWQAQMRALYTFRAGDRANLGASHVDKQLDWLYFNAHPRRTTAPTVEALHMALAERWLRPTTQGRPTLTESAASVGLPLSTLRNVVVKGSSPKYSTLVKVVAAAGLDMTVTMPGASLPDALGAGKDPVDVKTLLSRPPSFEQLQDMVRSRLNFSKQRLSAQTMASRRQLPTRCIEDLLGGRQPTYNTLRKITAALHIELIIRRPGQPMPDHIRHTRFAEDKPYLPIVQLREHNSTTSVEGRPIGRAAAPFDLEETEDAFYAIWPYTGDTGTGLEEGDYCLVMPDARRQQHQLAWLETLEGHRAGAPGRPARVLKQHTATMPDKLWPLQATAWEDNEHGPAANVLLSVPINNLWRAAPIVAAYEGPPIPTRPPQKRELR
ncbi:MAG: hypothetical protein OXG35_13290 [Acidobacteria bacterium]|nr:hypothetical protein [Acidobacteriota bacterium]